MTWFIDKLNVHQDYPEPLPLVGNQMVIRVDLATGDLVSESPNFKIVEGSYSTKLTVRCNGSRVSVTGNPGRYGRVDNLFGLTTCQLAPKTIHRLASKTVQSNGRALSVFFWRPGFP